jgi:hypothetical protein
VTSLNEIHNLIHIQEQGLAFQSVTLLFKKNIEKDLVVSENIRIFVPTKGDIEL